VCDRTATTRTTTPRAAHFFRKNAKKTREATPPKGFTSIACVPQKSKKLRENTSRNESKGFVRGAYVEMPRLRKIPESLGSGARVRQALRATIRESWIQIFTGLGVISEMTIHHHHKCAHNRVLQEKYPKNRTTSLLQTGYVEEASAVKIDPRAVKIPEELSKVLVGKWVMPHFIGAVKMPKSCVRQKRILTEVPDVKQHPEFEAAQGNTVKIPEVERRLSWHKAAVQ
jgi:hypothetical protein